MPTNGSPGSGFARNANGSPASCGATWTSTVNDPAVVAGPPTQPVPIVSPSDTENE